MLPTMLDAGKYRWSSNRLSSLSNFYTSHFGLLSNVEDETRKNLIDQVVYEIGVEHPRIDIVRLSPLDGKSAETRMLQESFSTHGWLTERYFCFQNLYEEVDGISFQEYLKARSSRIRKTAANRSRKFDRDSSNRFEIITDVTRCRKGVQIFDDLYKKRWRTGEPYPRFIPRLVEECAERGWLRLGIAWVNDQPAAAQLWIVKDRVAYIFKIAYDPQYDNLSIGSVSLYKMFEAVIDNDDVVEIDFLTGDDAYKRDWVSNSREKCGVAAYRKSSVAGLSAAARNLLPRYAKKVVRNLRQ
jgi:hypothetical protein